MAEKKRHCLNNPESFYVICDETFTKSRKSITDFAKSAYFNYFEVNFCNLQKPWVPNTVYQKCVVSFRDIDPEEKYLFLNSRHP